MALQKTVQLKQQREAMERQRFGYTREEVFAVKGEKCSYPKDDHEGDLVIDHKEGGGRHDTERGIIVEGKTKNMDNLRVLCRKHAGLIDRQDFTRGIGRNSPGNPNNPAQ